MSSPLLSICSRIFSFCCCTTSWSSFSFCEEKGGKKAVGELASLQPLPGDRILCLTMLGPGDTN